MAQQYDVAVIGGGPGGYVAAIRAAQLGMKTVCVERDALGGICLNWGCIPTKALLRNAELYRTMQDHGEALGFHFDNLTFDLDKVVGRSRKVASKLSGGVGYLFRKNGVEHIAGHATLRGNGRVRINDAEGNQKSEIAARHIIVATGARARQLPFAPFDRHKIWSYREAMVPNEIPERLVIIGAGAIGVEFAYVFNAFGSQVTILEMQDRLVPVEDFEIAAILRKEFESAGIAIKTGAAVNGVETTEDGVRVTLTHAGQVRTLECDKLLVAVGVQGNVEGLGLAELGIQVDRGRIVTDLSYRTAAPGVYAIGDVQGPPWLAHVASAEGICCVERIAGIDRPDVPYASVPGCTYCQPEIASVGKTEQALQAEGVPYEVGRFPYRALGKALAAMEEVGLVKILKGEHGELLGAHIVGHNATEMIHELVLAHTNELTTDELHYAIHAHPTLSEAIHEAVLDLEGAAIHF